MKAWMIKAAQEIQDNCNHSGGVDVVLSIIALHVPSEPTCKTCNRWTRGFNMGNFGYCYALSTRANIITTDGDFGCVQWEAKP